MATAEDQEPGIPLPLRSPELPLAANLTGRSDNGPCEDLSPRNCSSRCPSICNACSLVSEKIGPFNMVPFATSLQVPPWCAYYYTALDYVPSRDLLRRVAVKHRESKASLSTLYRACVFAGPDTSDNIQEELSRFPWGPALDPSSRS